LTPFAVSVVDWPLQIVAEVALIDDGAGGAAAAQVKPRLKALVELYP
jgi:hypothetical protein